MPGPRSEGGFGLRGPDLKHKSRGQCRRQHENLAHRTLLGLIKVILTSVNILGIRAEKQGKQRDSLIGRGRGGVVEVASVVTGINDSSASIVPVS